MEIRKTITPQIAALSGQTASALPAPSAEPKPVSVHTEVSQDWHLLEQGRELLQATSDFDADKVAALRQSLKDGTFALDIGELAGAMLRQHGCDER